MSEILQKLLKITNHDILVERPLLIQFHSNADIDAVRNSLKDTDGIISVSAIDCNPHNKGYAYLNDELIKMEEHPELHEHFFPPFEYKGKEDTAKCFLFFFGVVSQLQPEYINYCKRLSTEIKLPIIYLVNDYSDDPTNAMQDDFFEHIDVPLEQEDHNPAYNTLKELLTEIPARL